MKSNMKLLFENSKEIHHNKDTIIWSLTPAITHFKHKKKKKKKLDRLKKIHKVNNIQVVSSAKQMPGNSELIDLHGN